MAFLKISEEQATRLLQARNQGTATRKSVKKAVWSELRRQYGIPSTIKFKVAVEAPDNPMYRVLKNKYTLQPLDDGQGPDVAAPPAVQMAPNSTPAKESAPKATKKANGSKPSAATKKAVDPLTLKEYPLSDLRMTIAGKRVRLGAVKDLAAAKRAVAKYKRQHGIA